MGTRCNPEVPQSRPTDALLGLLGTRTAMCAPPLEKMMQQLLSSCWLLSALAIRTAAFSPLHTATTASVRTPQGIALYMATKRKKKKPSMAERRKRRQKKTLERPNPYADLPSPKLDFSSGDDDEDKVLTSAPRT
mgnify:CR=1 FL=1